MTLVLAELGYLLLLYLPVGGLVLWFYLKRRKQESETVAPFEELKRRPAGESNRLRVEELNEKMDPWLMQILTVALAAIGLAHINKVELGRRNRLLPFLSRLVLRQVIASLLKGSLQFRAGSSNAPSGRLSTW